MPDTVAARDVELDELRRLVVEASPDPAAAAPVAVCGEDELLDALVPFSSVIVLGVIVAVEDRYKVTVTREALGRVARGGFTLRKLARMLDTLRQAAPGGPGS